jgi:NAD(P)-dependent dehydrogenase (short-subunit alcohol dehydrogenase family)
MSANSVFGVEGRIALVTGASSGLGRASANYLARAGARVIGLARRAEALDQWRAEAGGQTASLIADLGAMEDFSELADQVSEPFGPPDILVNAAGLNLRQPADAVTPEGWRAPSTSISPSRSFWRRRSCPAMRDKGWGRIVNFASLQSRRAFANGIAYGASKGGVEQLTRAMAEAWSRDGDRRQRARARVLPDRTDRAGLRRRSAFLRPRQGHLHRPQRRYGRS